MKKELDLSTAPLVDDATEIVRIWLSENKPTFVISTDRVNDISSWGIILADLLRHVSRACAEKGDDETIVFKRIKEVFDVEISNPTE